MKEFENFITIEFIRFMLERKLYYLIFNSINKHR